MSDPRTAVLHLWRVPTRRVPGALLRMATTKAMLRGTPHLRFTKVLGTGTGRTFTVRDADPHHWALLTVWDDDRAATEFAADARHRALRSWQRIAAEQLVVRLQPIASRGEWSRQHPFGDPTPQKVSGPVASITRARITARKAVSFWRAVPPVSHDLHQVEGLRLAVGVGEAPIGLQGTFSVWDDAQALSRFAHRREPHVDAIRRTALEGWYAEELFARFAVLGAHGTHDGRTLDLPTG